MTYFLNEIVPNKKNAVMAIVWIQIIYRDLPQIILMGVNMLGLQSGNEKTEGRSAYGLESPK